MNGKRIVLAMSAAALCAGTPVAVSAQEMPPPAAPAESTESLKLTLPAGTPVVVVLEDDLTSKTSRVGDTFGVTVVNDVPDQAGTVVIPAGTSGDGDVTFVTDNGAFGKPGILGITLRVLTLNGRSVALDGRYREVGRAQDGVAAATMFAIGIPALPVAALVRGKPSVIPKGRVLRARTGEDIVYSPAQPSAPAAQPTPAAAAGAAADPASQEPASQESHAAPAGNPQPAAASSQLLSH